MTKVSVEKEETDGSVKPSLSATEKGEDEEGTKKEAEEEEGEEEEEEDATVIAFAGKRRRLKSSSSLKLFKNQVSSQQLMYAKDKR